MKKFIKNALIFLFLFVIIYLGAFFALANLKISSQPLINKFDNNLGQKGTVYRASLEYKKNKPFDIAVFGSSHAYRGYDPRIFEKKMGKTIFNFGSSAQSVPNSFHYIKNETALNDYEFVILDLLVTIFENTELESSIMLVRNVPQNGLATDIFWDEKDIRLLNIYLARYLALNDTGYFKNPFYVKNGFISRSETMITPESVQGYEPFNPNPRAIKRFEQILSYCDQEKIPLVLVNQPRPKETNPDKNREFSEFIHELIKDYSFPYFDYSMDHNLSTGPHYYDLGHMNQKGVEYFNDRLCSDLNQLLNVRKQLIE